MASYATINNEKQCSRQLQYEVPCSIGNVINFSLFINSSLSSLPSTSHAACCPRGGVGVRGGACLLPVMLHIVHRGGQEGLGGQGTFQSSCHILHYHMVLRPKGTSHNEVHVETMILVFDLVN